PTIAWRSPARRSIIPRSSCRSMGGRRTTRPDAALCSRAPAAIAPAARAPASATWWRWAPAARRRARWASSESTTRACRERPHSAEPHRLRSTATSGDRPMKRTHILISMLLLAGCRRPASSKVGTDLKDRESYGLGYQLGKSLQNQHTEVNLDAYVSGLREALAGAPSQVSDDELKK